MKPRALLQAFLLLLSGCAGSNAARDGFPSLQLRPIESKNFDEPAEAPPPEPAAPEPELVSQVDALRQRAADGNARFQTQASKTQGLVQAAQGAAVSSEAWVQAQLAISQLEADRNQSVGALASLDMLYVERMNLVADGKVSGGAEVIDAARKEVLQMVDAQNDRLDALKSGLKIPA